MTQVQDGGGRISPDGRWIAYPSDETGRDEVYLMPFPDGGARYQASIDGGTYPRWRGDGKELYWRARDGQLVAASVATTPRIEVGTPMALFDAHMARRRPRPLRRVSRRSALHRPARKRRALP